MPYGFTSDPAPQQLTAPCRKCSGRQRHPIEQGAYPMILHAIPRIVSRPRRLFLVLLSLFSLAFAVFCLTSSPARCQTSGQDPSRTGVRPVPDQSQTTILSGNVVDARTGAPLEQVLAVIEPTGAKALTDAAGRFELRGLAPGVYRVTVSVVGYALYRAGGHAGRGP